MSARTVADRIAWAVFDDEREAAQALGYSDASDLVSALRAAADVLEIAAASYRPAVWPRGSEPVRGIA